MTCTICGTSPSLELDSGAQPGMKPVTLGVLKKNVLDQHKTEGSNRKQCDEGKQTGEDCITLIFLDRLRIPGKFSSVADDFLTDHTFQKSLLVGRIANGHKITTHDHGA